jgi:hypothetical protein
VNWEFLSKDSQHFATLIAGTLAEQLVYFLEINVGHYFVAFLRV